MPETSRNIPNLINPRENIAGFRQALGQFVTGVTVVTARDDAGQPLGMTANSFASVSLDPPLVLWSPAKTSKRHAAFTAASHYAIHIMADAQSEQTMRFAKDAYDFDGLECCTNAQNVPMIENCLARFECSQFALHDAGDHTIVIGLVEQCETSAGAPLVFGQGKYLKV